MPSLLLSCADAYGDKHFGLDTELVWRGVRDYHRAHSVDLPYLPSSLLLLSAVAPLSLASARILGLSLTAAAFLVSSCTAGRLACRGTFSTLSAIVLILISASPVGRSALVLANVGLAVQAALGVTLVLASLGRWRAAAAVFTIACCVKPNIAPAGLIFVAARQWQCLAAIASGFVAANASGLLLLADPARYLRRAAAFATSGRTDVHTAVPLGAANNFTLSASGPGLGLPSPAVLALRALVVAVCVFIVARTWNDHRSPWRLTALATTPVLALFLAGGLAEPHYVLVAAPLAAGLILSQQVAVAGLTALATGFVVYNGSIPFLGLSYVERLTLGVSLLVAATTMAVRRRAVPSVMPPTLSRLAPAGASRTHAA